MKVRPQASGLLVCVLGLFTSGCDTFLDRVQSTSDSLDRWAVGQGLAPKTGESIESIYQQGLRSKRAGNLNQAAARFREAAVAGHAAAAYELSEAYRQGKGVALDPDAAADWQAKAAERGEARAQYLLGAAYSQGLGVERNDERALHWLGESATQGHAPAQFLLAEAFANGRGIDPDMAWAARWYGKAARQGHHEAQFTFGLILATGNGLPQDLAAALAWLTIAAKGGHGAAEEARQSLTAAMDKEAVDAANVEAERFVPGPNRRFADPPTVMYVQHRLNALGFGAGTVDGLMGPRTRAGIRAYQSARGQPYDGQLTPELLMTLLRESQS